MSVTRREHHMMRYSQRHAKLTLPLYSELVYG